jgi:RNA polymerase sigma factor (sigma-70 family)
MKIEKVEQIHKVSLEDFMQIGRIEVLKALETFESGRCTFSSYVYMKIKSRVIKELQSLEAEKRDNRKTTGTELIQLYADITNVEKYVVNKILVEQLLSNINEHQKTVLFYRLQGYTFKEISALLGRGSFSTMSQAYNLAIKKMRKGA